MVLSSLEARLPARVVVLVAPAAPLVLAVAAAQERWHPLLVPGACQQPAGVARAAGVAQAAVRAWVAFKAWVAVGAAVQA